MTKNRLEAFSDGVFAIIITIMVLELKIPHDTDPVSLASVLPSFFSYVLSFTFLGIYWNNHHHFLYTVKKVNGSILWANLHLLFWLSLVPFATGFMGENHFSKLPLMLYGAVQLMAAFAFYILELRIIKIQGSDSILAKAVGKDIKGKISPILFIAAIISAQFNEWIAGGIYVFVALMWLIPDKRIEKMLEGQGI